MVETRQQRRPWLTRQRIAMGTHEVVVRRQSLAAACAFHWGGGAFQAGCEGMLGVSPATHGPPSPPPKNSSMGNSTRHITNGHLPKPGSVFLDALMLLIELVALFAFWMWLVAMRPRR